MRYAIVGTGPRAVAHVRIAADLREDGLIDEFVVCGADERRVRDLGGCFSAPVRTDVSNLSADAAAIAAPPSVRYELGKRLLAAGTDLLVEPPLARSAADAWDLVETADEAGRVLAVGGRPRHHPALRALRRRIERGELGDLRYLQTDRFAARSAADSGDRRSLLVPELDVQAFLLDATSRDLGESFVAVEDDGTVAAVLEFGGATGVVTASRRPSVSGPCHRVIAVGNDRAAVVDLLETDVLELYETPADGVPATDIDSGADLDPATPAIEAVDPARAEVVDFLHAAETAGIPAVPGRVGAESLELFASLGAPAANRDRSTGPEELTYGG